MRVFLTGATGFIGTAVAAELIAAGHSVLGVARTPEAGRGLASRGIDPHIGELADHASFIAGAQACDAVAHCAFIHDFSKFVENIEIERATVRAMLEALAGSGKPFIASSGVGMVAPGRVVTEYDQAPREGRGLTEAVVREAADRGVRTGLVRLPPITYADGSGGFLPELVRTAKAKGVAAYVGDGMNRWCAGHRLDAARLYRLALEKGEAGAAYMAVGDEGVPMREIAGAIAARLGIETASIPPEEAMAHFGWLGRLVGTDIPASSALTQQRLGWRPTQPGLLEEIRTAITLGG